MERYCINCNHCYARQIRSFDYYEPPEYELHCELDLPVREEDEIDCDSYSSEYEEEEEEWRE